MTPQHLVRISGSGRPRPGLDRYRKAAERAFAQATWRDVEIPPAKPEDALYFLAVDSGEDLETFAAAFGQLSPELCARTIIEGSMRGVVWRLLDAYGFAGAWGVDYGLIGRLDVMRELDPELRRAGPKRPDRTPIAPNYTLIRDDAEQIVVYLRALVARLDAA